MENMSHNQGLRALGKASDAQAILLKDVEAPPLGDQGQQAQLEVVVPPQSELEQQTRVVVTSPLTQGLGSPHHSSRTEQANEVRGTPTFGSGIGREENLNKHNQTPPTRSPLLGGKSEASEQDVLSWTRWPDGLDVDEGRLIETMTHTFASLGLDRLQTETHKFKITMDSIRKKDPRTWPISSGFMISKLKMMEETLGRLERKSDVVTRRAPAKPKKKSAFALAVEQCSKPRVLSDAGPTETVDPGVQNVETDRCIDRLDPPGGAAEPALSGATAQDHVVDSIEADEEKPLCVEASRPLTEPEPEEEEDQQSTEGLSIDPLVGDVRSVQDFLSVGYKAMGSWGPEESLSRSQLVAVLGVSRSQANTWPVAESARDDCRSDKPIPPVRVFSGKSRDRGDKGTAPSDANKTLLFYLIKLI